MGGEDREAVWTEVLSEGIMVLWAWDGSELGAFITPLDGFHVDEDAAEAISRYADDKHVDLVVEKMYDESDFDGTLQEFMHEEIGGNVA